MSEAGGVNGWAETIGTGGYMVVATSGNTQGTGEIFANYKFVPGLPGLTAGFWSQHQLEWNGIADDPKTAGNLVSSHVLSLMDVNPNFNELLLGDGTANHLQISLLAAQEIINQSTSGDSHVIMLNQAIASQLNDYNDGGHEPNGLIEAAVTWLTTTYAAGGTTPTGGHVDTNTDGILETQSITAAGKVAIGSSTITGLTASAIEQLYVGENISGTGIPLNSRILSMTENSATSFSITIDHSATSNVNNDNLTFNFSNPTEYNTGTKLFAAALPSSSPAWSGAPQSAWAHVFDEAAVVHPNTGNVAVDATQVVVVADGEGLKNALAAYNQGQLVISSDGNFVGWNSGGVVSDVHANTNGAFWEILEDQISLIRIPS